MAKSQYSISMLILSSRGTFFFFLEKLLLDYNIFFRQNKTSTNCIKCEFSSPNNINVGDSNEQMKAYM